MIKKQISKTEFIALMASLMAIVALCMDALLPALGVISEEVGVANPNDAQLLVTMMFMGIGMGQLITGPLSDSLGRKVVIYIGILIFLIGSIVIIFSTTFEFVLLGRIIQGIGLSSPRTLSMAIVRDTFKGNSMAKIMSFISVVFIIVPAIAPTLGKVILDLFGWRAIFHMQIIFGLIVVTWLSYRQPETLKPENKNKFNLPTYINGVKFFFKSTQSVLYTIIFGFFIGAFMFYLGNIQQIFDKHYHMEEEFPYIFAINAITIGLSTLLNGKLVMKLGMKKLVLSSCIFFSFICSSFLFFFNSESPSVVILMVYFLIMFLSYGFIFGNIVSLALEPLGKIAGMGAALNGCISSIFGVIYANYMGAYADNTPAPIFLCFLIAGLVSTVFILSTKYREKRKTKLAINNDVVN